MKRRLASILTAAALAALAGQAAAQSRSQCENMRVIVRNGVYAIQGLEAFCTEFENMRSELASMKKALSDARTRNHLLEARLAARSTGESASPRRDPRAENHTQE